VDRLVRPRWGALTATLDSVGGGIEIESSDDVDWSGGPIELPVNGFAVQIVEFPIRVWAYGDGPKHIKMFISGKFVFGQPNEPPLLLDAESDSWERLAAILVLREDRIARATVSPTSVLRIEFESGRFLESSPSPGDPYEQWELVAPGFFIVGTPDQPTVWTGRAWEQAD
jgi:hypothetical protein